MLPNKKTSVRLSSSAEKEPAPGAFSFLKKNPLLLLGIIAAVPVLGMLAFTFKSGYAPNHRKSAGEFEKIVILKTPTELANDATAALQKKDLETFSEIINTQLSDINAVNSKGDSLLIAAATMGNLEAVQQLVLAGADVNKKNAFTKDTALLRSLYGNNSEITRLLVYSGADINAKNNYNHSPMYLALEKQRSEFVDIFLTSGVREGLSSDYLFRATATKNFMGVMAMLKGGVDPNIKNDKGNTPLIISASLGDLPSVEALLDYRADLNAANKDGNTPLIYAARYNHPLVIKELLEPHTMQAPLNVNAQNKQGQTALYWGAAKGYVDVVRRLLAAGADPTLPANDGSIPYVVAKKNKRKEVLPWFEKDLIAVKNSVIEEDNAALIAKAKAEKKELPSEKIKEIIVTDQDIFKAAKEGDIELATKVIKQNKAVVFDKNKEGDTPLLVAVASLQPKMVDFLVEKESRLFEASPKGNMFHIAVKTQNMDMLKQVVDIARKDGRLSSMLEYRVPVKGYSMPFTPIGFAALDCNQEMYDYLVSIGAKPGSLSSGKQLINIASPADLMEKCKAKKIQAKTLTPKKTTSKTTTTTKKTVKKQTK